MAIEKISCKRKRRQVFRKKSKKLLEMASNLSILCDVDISLIMFAPTRTGGIKHFPENLPRLQEILKKFVQSFPGFISDEGTTQYSNVATLLLDQARDLEPGLGELDALKDHRASVQDYLEKLMEREDVLMQMEVEDQGPDQADQLQEQGHSEGGNSSASTSSSSHFN